MKSYTKDHYSLRRLLPGQWKEYKSIRLEALQTSPEMFGSHYAGEAAYDQNAWEALLENDNRAMFALYHLTSLIGVTGVAVKKEDPATAFLIASFIKPAHRGNGLTKLFYQARIDWAHDKACRSVMVSHRAGNECSKAAIRRSGFQYTHTVETAWPDGSRADELMYSLDL